MFTTGSLVAAAERSASSGPLRATGGLRRDTVVGEFVRQREAAVVSPPKYVVEDRVMFHENFSLAVPTASGCYIISDMRGPLYVGKAGSLRQRFIDHLRRSHNAVLRRAVENPWGRIEFSWVRHDPEGLSAAETWLIVSLQPICNQNVTLIPVDPAVAGRS